MHGSTAHACVACSTARHEWLGQLGYAPQEFADKGLALAVTEVSIRFLGPLKSQDTFVATVTVQKTFGARVQLLQTIEKVDF